MKTFATFVTVITAAGLVTLKMMENMPDRPATGTTAISFDEATKRLVNYRCFKETLETALKELKEEKLSLAEATAHVHGAASLYWPVYLREVKNSDPGKTSRENVARNLIGHLRRFVEVEPEVAARLTALEIELQDLLIYKGIATAPSANLPAATTATCANE